MKIIDYKELYKDVLAMLLCIAISILILLFMDFFGWWHASKMVYCLIFYINILFYAIRIDIKYNMWGEYGYKNL